MHRPLAPTAKTRPVRRTLALAALAALVSVLAAGATPAASSAQHCYPIGSKTLVRTKLLRVYATRKTHFRALNGCLFKTGSTIGLDYAGAGINAWFAPPAIDVHGTLVGWADTSFDTPSGQSLVLFIKDLAHPDREQFSVSYETIAAVGSLRVISKRALAWTECDYVTNGPLKSQKGCAPPAHYVFNTLQVYDANNTSNKPTQLDQGMHLDAFSLRRRGNTVFWRQGGTRHSAVLTP